MTTWIVTDGTPGSGPRVAVKDLIDMAGLPTTAASRPVADRAGPAERDAPCVAGLRAAIDAGQARFVGKTNLHELAYGITGINAAFGTPVNPLDPLRMPGGSSSGSGVAVAAGEADIAYGTDTGGSIRIPAACCGITGLKTTWGRIPLDGVWPLAPGLDTVGPMARDVAGVAAGMALLEPGFTVASEAPRSVGVLTIDADPRITAAIDDALRRAEFDLVPVTIPDLEKIMAASFTVLDAQAWQSNQDLFAAAAGQIGGDVRDRLERAGTITPAQVTSAQAVLAGWRETLDGLWRRVDMLAAPSLLGFPPLLDEVHLLWKLRMLTSPVNVAGVPALALPVPIRGRDAGPIPANVQLIGPHNSEERLLAAGARIERAVLPAQYFPRSPPRARDPCLLPRHSSAPSSLPPSSLRGQGRALRLALRSRLICLRRICRRQRGQPPGAIIAQADGMAQESKIPVFSEQFRQSLVQRRVLVLDGVLDDDNGTVLAAQLLTLADEDPDADVALWINSPGGSVPSMLAIRDVMRLIPCDVATLAFGIACSAGQFLLSAGTKGKRYALPHSRILMHQGSAGIAGSAVEVELQAADLRLTRDTVLGLIAEDTGQPMERIFEDSRHDHWYTAPEARDYGFVDAIAGTFAQVMPARKRPFGLRPTASTASSPGSPSTAGSVARSTGGAA